MSEETQGTNARHVGRTRMRRRLKIIAVAAVVACPVIAVLLYWCVPYCYDVPDRFETWVPPGIVVKDRDGRVLAHLPDGNHYRGGHTPLVELPPDFVNATLVAEDKRFYSHGGIDFRAVLRAAVSQVTPFYRKSGASTITQQLVKISSPPAPRNLATKFRECMTARRLEMTCDKDEILSSYFDRLDYGSLRMGPSAAADYYFGKRIGDLSLGQMALLAGLPQSPSRLNPYRNPRRALDRRNWILDRLERELGYDPGRIRRAREEPLNLAARLLPAPLAPHLMSRILRKGSPSGEVRTTIDSRLQELAERVVSNTLFYLREQHATQAAVVVIHNPTGEILAWVGSGNRKDPEGGQLDGVLATRSAGSTLKPFVYALALENGMRAGDVFADVPIHFRSRHGVDAPTNFNNRYRGPVTMREALACSQNIPAMEALKSAGGGEKLVALLRELGVTTLDKPASHYGLGLAIGNAEVRLLELANAYAALARRGIAKPVTWLAGEPAGGGRRVLGDEICFLLTDILADEAARVPAFGVGGPLDVGFPCAVKTGTSSDFRDNWCVGYTHDVTVGVWVGNFNFTPMRDVSGVSGAGPVFHAIMVEANGRYPSRFGDPPPGYRRVAIDRRNGLRKGDRNIPAEFAVAEWVSEESLPRLAGSEDYDDEGRALLDGRYKEWVAGPDNGRKDAYALSSRLWAGTPPQITAPLNNTVLLLDPEIPNRGRILHLKSTLPSDSVWFSDTLRIIDDNGHPAAELRPGTHVIKAVHEETGLGCETTIRVRSL